MTVLVVSLDWRYSPISNNTARNVIMIPYLICNRYRIGHEQMKSWLDQMTGSRPLGTSLFPMLEFFKILGSGALEPTFSFYLF